MKVVMSEKRNKIVNALKGANADGMTLAEISAAIGEEVKSGTTNPMVAAGVIKKVGKRKVAKVVYVEVDTYAVGDQFPGLPDGSIWGVHEYPTNLLGRGPELEAAIFFECFRRPLQHIEAGLVKANLFYLEKSADDKIVHSVRGSCPR